uniref:Uncharacterized protein n=1 Tax=Cyprinus carpio TaxID=7962 RepID=A0A8C2IXM0_CYPCA
MSGNKTAEDLQNFMKELNTWEEDVRDPELSRSGCLFVCCLFILMTKKKNLRISLYFHQQKNKGWSQQSSLAFKGTCNKTLFRDGRYDSAIQCYTGGMDADPYSPVLPTSRAAFCFRLQKFAVAESDCNLAIAADGKYVNAYIRRVAARAALNKHQDIRITF